MPSSAPRAGQFFPDAVPKLAMRQRAPPRGAARMAEADREVGSADGHFVSRLQHDLAVRRLPVDESLREDIEADARAIPAKDGVFRLDARGVYGHMRVCGVSNLE